MTTSEPVHLDGRSLTRAQLVAVAHGAGVALDADALRAVARAADFLSEKAAHGEPICSVSAACSPTSMHRHGSGSPRKALRRLTAGPSGK